MVRVDNIYVKYHTTYNGTTAPVVGQCNIKLEIIGTPESVAVHLKNNTSEEWSGWMAFDPDIGENTVQLDWTLLPGSGIKNVYMQVATYTGLTQTAVLIIVADYNRVVYKMNFYKPLDTTLTPTIPMHPFSDLDSEDIWTESNMLPDLENVPVAATRSGDVSDYIFIEIIPEISYMEQFKDMSNEDKESGLISPTFDFIHQGGHEEIRIPMMYNKSESGIESFRGRFVINKEDSSLFIDGLANILPHFRNDCSDPDTESIGADTSADIEYRKDIYNIVMKEDQQIAVNYDDVWSGDRTDSGQLQYPTVLRPQEDPYLIFGDPKYRLKDQNE